MRKVYIDLLRPGMVVGYAVHNSRGEMLVNRGTVLTQRYIDRLIQQGIPALYIADDFFPDIDSKDIIDEQTRVKAIKQVKTVLKGSSSKIFTFEETMALQRTVDEILTNLLNNQSLMINLNDIRSMDDYLFGHCVNVCVLSLVTGIQLGYDKVTMSILGMGALLHDLGKIIISREILDKPGKLNAEEYEEIKKHPDYSYDILINQQPRIKKLSAIIAWQHHERMNGEGYPRGLTGDGIHRLSQIVGMADMYDAMTADRVYRRGIPPNEVYEMLSACGDYYFDYELVKAFLHNIAPYPVGTVVRLNTNEIGVVSRNNKRFPFSPRVTIVVDRTGSYLQNKVEKELSSGLDLYITGVLDNAEIEELKIATGLITGTADNTTASSIGK
ncbi:MAG: HD-GYP domain-containing protein [Firmicutes bacterium]|nr:HD-GYP domain-containing protein [Bacillota bacterium]